MKSLAKAYDPQVFEKNIAEQWESSGAFRVDAHSKKPAFTISMPPPNATGQLHVGHAVMLVLEDIFTRWHRMDGHESLWLPGTDHAAIATENVVLQQIKGEIGNHQLLKTQLALKQNPPTPHQKGMKQEDVTPTPQKA